MIFLKNREEIELMRESALMVSRTLGLVAKEVKPGVTPFYFLINLQSSTFVITEAYLRSKDMKLEVDANFFRQHFAFPSTKVLYMAFQRIHL